MRLQWVFYRRLRDWHLTWHRPTPTSVLGKVFVWLLSVGPVEVRRWTASAEQVIAEDARERAARERRKGDRRRER